MSNHKELRDALELFGDCRWIYATGHGNVAIDTQDIRDALAGLDRLIVPRPANEWNEDDGAVLWWTLPVVAAPYCGTPNDIEWPWRSGWRLNFPTHWTPLPNLVEWGYGDE